MRKAGLVMIIVFFVFSIFVVSAQEDICQFDFNKDGIVNEGDSALLTISFGSTIGDVNYNETYDLNKDDTINFLDFILISKNYGKTCVIEPPAKPIDADDDCAGRANGVQAGNCSGENYCYSGFCCGDDANEYFVYQKSGTSPYIKDEPSKGKCYIQETKPNFCFFADDGRKPFDVNTRETCWPGNFAGAVNNRQYRYEEGQIAGSIIRNLWRGAVCNKGVWDELCDVSKKACNAGCGVQWQTKSVWMNDKGFCCGDDCGEFYIKGGDGTSACCSGEDYLVENGKCHKVVHDAKVEIISPTSANTSEEVEVKAKISNIGSYNESVDISFFVEDKNGSVVHEEEKITQLGENETREVPFIWTAVEGVYNFIIQIFVEKDSDELNNKAQSEINVSGAAMPECSIEEKKCEGTDYFTCVNGEWFNEGKVPGKCGVEFPAMCEDTDDGLDYFTVGNAKMKINGRYKGYKDVCKKRPTTNLGDLLNGVNPGGGAVVYNDVTGYLYEAYCKDGIPSIKIKECDCFKGACI